MQQNRNSKVLVLVIVSDQYDILVSSKISTKPSNPWMTPNSLASKRRHQYMSVAKKRLIKTHKIYTSIQLTDGNCKICSLF